MARKPQTKTAKQIESTIIPYASPAPDALYDIGVGLKSEYVTLRKKWTDMKVFGCEPNPSIHEKLLKKFPGMLLRCALSTRRGEVPLYNIDSGEEMDCSTVKPYCKHRQIALVPTMTLDEFDERSAMANGSFPQRIILWMDIEGAELDVLQSGKKLMSSGRVVAINLEVREEVLGDTWCSAKQVNEHLCAIGYKWQRKYNNQRTHWDVIYTL